MELDPSVAWARIADSSYLQAGRAGRCRIIIRVTCAALQVSDDRQYSNRSEKRRPTQQAVTGTYM